MSKKKLIKPAEKAEILTELVKAHMQRFDNTRRIQWTFNGLFWTGILVAASFLKSIPEYHPDTHCNFLVYSIFICASYFVVLLLFQMSLNWDKNKFKNYRRILEEMINAQDHSTNTIAWSIVWTIMQLAVTILLMLGVYRILQ